MQDEIIYANNNINKFKELKTLINAEFNRRNQLDSRDYIGKETTPYRINNTNLDKYIGGEYNFIEEPKSSLFINEDHGDKTINLMSVVNNLLENISRDDIIKNIDSYLTLVQNWSSQDRESSNHGCSAQCTGLCVGSCFGECNGCVGGASSLVE